LGAGQSVAAVAAYKPSDLDPAAHGVVPSVAAHPQPPAPVYSLADELAEGRPEATSNTPNPTAHVYAVIPSADGGVEPLHAGFGQAGSGSDADYPYATIADDALYQDGDFDPTADTGHPPTM